MKKQRTRTCNVSTDITASASFIALAHSSTLYRLKPNSTTFDSSNVVEARFSSSHRFLRHTCFCSKASNHILGRGSPIRSALLPMDLVGSNSLSRHRHGGMVDDFNINSTYGLFVCAKGLHRSVHSPIICVHVLTRGKRKAFLSCRDSVFKLRPAHRTSC